MVNNEKNVVFDKSSIDENIYRKKNKKLIQNNKKKGIFLLLTIILSLSLSLASVYFIYKYKDSRENSLLTGLVSIDFKEGAAINLNSNLPVIDDIGLENTPYNFSITNKSSIVIDTNIQLDIQNATTIKLGAVRYALYINDELVKKDYVHEDDLTLYTYQYLNVGETIYCKIKFWVDYYYNEPGKVFSAKIKAEGKSLDIMAKEVIKISNIEDLVDLSLNVNNGEDYQDTYFILTRNLDFKNTNSYENSERVDYGDINGNNNVESLFIELTSECETCGGFIPIGNSTSNSFQGIFNGQEYRIDNLFESDISNKSDMMGLFGSISDVQLNNLTISGKIEIERASKVGGGIVGRITGTSTIDNCHNEVNIESNFSGGSLGGIVGFNVSPGILLITNSSNSGNVMNSNNVGGLIGFSSGDLTIKNSLNYGNITNNLGLNVGGLLGRDNSATDNITIINSHNEGYVTSNLETLSSESSSSAGGLIGRIYGYIIVKDSYNNGEVTSTILNPNGAVTNGGIVGRISNSCYMENVYNLKNVTGGYMSSGIIGYATYNGTVLSNIILDKVYNRGNITSVLSSVDNNHPYLGGIIGYGNGNISILNSFNAGNIQGGYNIGGLFGRVRHSIVNLINNYNVGNITSNESMSNGTGYFYNFDSHEQFKYVINNFYNLGDLSGNSYNSGVAYINSSTDPLRVSVKNGYYKNNATAGIKGLTSLNANTTSMAEANIKSSAFVNTLNSNINSINLGDIDSKLASHKLSHWKLGSDGYPVFDWQ